MEVTIQETTTIYPSKPPFQENHILPLSYLDTDRNLDVTFRYFRVYQPQTHQDPFTLITTSLSTALVSYYPFTGRLQQCSAEDGRVVLHCTLDSGILVVQATVDSTLESLNYLDEPNDSFSEQLVPNPGPSEAMDHPMILQLTMFKCGGYVLGSAVHNMMCDGLGASEFFNLVAELARGVTRVSVEPVWNRVGLFGAREPGFVEFPFGDVLTLDKEFSPYNQEGVGPVGKMCFDMNDSVLDRFKTYLFENSGSRFTTFEALGAFIWHAKVKASKIPQDENVKFAYLMNIRKVVNPPIPKGYYGNACMQMYVQLKSQELLNQPIWKTAELIKKSKYNATNEYVKSYIDFQKIHYEDGISGGTEVSGFTDWRHIGHSTVDFGSGGPVTVFPLSKNFLGSMEPSYFLPFSSVDNKDKKCNNGFKLLVYLRECAMQGFQEDMDKFCGGEFA